MQASTPAICGLDISRWKHLVLRTPTVLQSALPFRWGPRLSAHQMVHIEQKYGRTISLVLSCPDREPVFQYGAERACRPASLIKLFLFAVLLEEASRDADFLQQSLSFNPAEHRDTKGTGILQHRTTPTSYTIREYMDLMLGYSDNIATNILIGYLGMEHINQRIRCLGFAHTELRRRMYGYTPPADLPENTTTALDVVQLLRQLYGNNSSRQWTLQVLEKADERRLLRVGLFSDATLYCKSGVLSTAYHEAGYLHREGRYFSFALLTEFHDPKEHTHTAAVFAEIGRSVQRTIVSL